MKYVKNYDRFKEFRIVNEEFVGKLFQKLMGGVKKNISMSYSKKFGTASKADKVIAEYQQKAIEGQKLKLIPLKALAEYTKNVKAGGEFNKDELVKLQLNYKKQDELYTRQLEKMRDIYNAKLDDIVEEEDDKKIKNYIKIKKLEMEEQLLLNEIKLIQQEVGMTDQQIQDDKTFKEMMSNLSKRSDENSKQQKSEEEILKSESVETKKSFDFEKARLDKEYKGPFFNQKFDVGEEIKIYVRNSKNDKISTLDKDGEDYRGTTAFVFARDINDDKEKIRVGYDQNTKDTFTIDRSRVISTKKDDSSEVDTNDETSEENLSV